MKKIFVIIILMMTLGSYAYSVTIDSLIVSPFGKVTIYIPAKVPDEVIFWVPGNKEAPVEDIGMAGKFADLGTFVIEINLQAYFQRIKNSKMQCYYPAGDFESLSMAIQKKYNFKNYYKPILVGYSSGASLVYAMLAQAPGNTFKGAIALDFCPELESEKPMCKGVGLTSYATKPGKSYYIEAAKHLAVPFIVLQGMNDQVCTYENIKKFMENMPNGELVSIPNAGHGFSVVKDALPQLLTAYQKIVGEPGFSDKITAKNTTQQKQELAVLNTTLPLTIIPSDAKDNLPLVVFISGDGGWSTLDHGVSVKLAADGMPVLGLDSQKYFWDEKQPKETADEIARAVSYYLKLWNRSSFIIVGYSFGACVAPFIANNFSPQVKEILKGVFCLSPDESGDFEIHIADMLSFKTNEKYDVLNEMKSISALNPVCIFGSEENAELRNKFTVKGIKVEILSGAHHYDNNYSAIVGIIFKDYQH